MLTAGGFVCIESIKEGDEVYSCNADTGEIGLKKVQETYVHEVTELVHLTIDDEIIDTTREHPFFLEGLGFIAASELRAGDEIRLYDGSTGVVKSVEIEILETPVNVYNFEVEDWHTYYVGEEGALVHNWCEGVNGRSDSGKYQVGAYKDIKGVDGYDAHHAGQKALMKKLVDNYDPNTAPAINVPKVGHTIAGPDGIVSRSTKGITNARQLLARDLLELKRVYPDIPNSALRELIDMNLKMYPEMRK